MLYDLDQLSNYLVNDHGLIAEYQRQKEPYSNHTYRLYRFLTELEDLVNSVTDEIAIIRLLIPKVRKLLTECYWLQSEYNRPSGKTNYAVKPLYEDLDYPLTIQNVMWLPQQISSIHNHGTWGIVGVISGQEKNKIWRRYGESGQKLELVGEKILFPGDVIAFTSNAIHSIESLGNEPTITFNLYGVTDFANRYEYNPITHQAKNF